MGGLGARRGVQPLQVDAHLPSALPQAFEPAAPKMPRRPWEAQWPGSLVAASQSNICTRRGIQGPPTLKTKEAYAQCAPRPVVRRPQRADEKQDAPAKDVCLARRSAPLPSLPPQSRRQPGRRSISMAARHKQALDFARKIQAEDSEANRQQDFLIHADKADLRSVLEALGGAQLDSGCLAKKVKPLPALRNVSIQQRRMRVCSLAGETAALIKSAMSGPQERRSRSAILRRQSGRQNQQCGAGSIGCAEGRLRHLRA